MSSATVLDTLFGFSSSETRVGTQCPGNHNRPSLWNAKQFGEEQVRSLVRQLFFQAGARTPRQVVFAGVDEGHGVPEICLQVGHALSARVSGSVCIVEVGKASTVADCQFQLDEAPESQETGRWLRESAVQIKHKLWVISSSAFQRDETILTPPWLRVRLDELRLDFDYTLFHVPGAAQSSDSLLLGHFCDGVVLVLNANSTRRVAAKTTKEKLSSANVRLLGTVLSGRKFPIPESIYRRL